MLPSNSLCCIFSETGTASLRCYSDQAGTFWFIARDVFSILNISGTQQALTRLEAPDKASAGTGNPYGLHKHTITISEQGLYDLTITSRKPGAKAFKSRLLGHISPTLRTLARSTRKGAPQ
jgi:anti-repressor protein